MQGQADYPFHSVSNLYLADPDGATAVGVFLQYIIDGHKDRGPVVVGEVPLYPAGNPGAEHSYKGGFYNVLVVDEIVIVRFVQRAEQPTAYLRQNRNLKIFVFKINCVVGLVLTVVGQDIEHRIGIYPALRPLVSSAGVEPGIGVRFTDEVGRNDAGLLPHPYRRFFGYSGRCKTGKDQYDQENSSCAGFLACHVISPPI